MNVTAYDIAMRFTGTKEVAGVASNPLVLAMLKLDGDWPQDDSVPWCSAFANFVAHLLRLPRSKALNARSWLKVGTPIPVGDAKPGFDVVILNRQNGPTNPDLDGPGHVGFFGGIEGQNVIVLGGNQGDAVSLARFPVADILGVRRLA